MMKNRSERNSSSVDGDVGLGLKIQTDSSAFENARSFPFSQYHCDSAGKSDRIRPFAGGGGPIFLDVSSIKATSGTDIFAAGGKAVRGESLFTASQFQEWERQKTIHKYMMASVPIPHELMLPLPSLAAIPQSHNIGVDSRLSSSKADPEPWRCRRTDGKKWRCSRDAAADQRYCERHAHKNKPRSRKHVEVDNTSNRQLQTPQTSHQFPLIAPAVGAMPFDQARCVRGGSRGTTRPHDSTCDYQQLSSMHRGNTHHQKNVSQFQTHHKQDLFATLVPDRFGFSHGQYCNPILDSKITSFQENLSLNSDLLTHSTTTPHFINAWEKEGTEGLSPSSLTLSMSSGSNSKRKNEDHFGIGMTPPGGPLGEALCIGNFSNSSLIYSPNDYANASSRSREDGSRAFNFIG